MIEEKNLETNNPFLKEIVYIENNREVGNLKYLLIYDKMEIENIVVLEEYRHHGIGTKLMAKLISIAINNKSENITLEVRISNEVAIGLYKKFGFREVALRKFYYGNEDAILMEKQVM
jgi:[ribosomal protein S18]-alanine N-acetyltransferase